MENFTISETTKVLDFSKKDLLKYQLMYLQVAGILSSEKTRENALKQTLYNIYSLLTIILLALTTLLMAGKILERWGDTDLVASQTFLLSLLVSEVTTGVHFVMHRGQLREILLSLQTTVLSSVQNVAPTSIQNKYIGKASRYANRLLAALTVAITLAFTSWVIIPNTFLVISIISGRTDRDDPSIDESVFLLWLPKDFTESPKQEITLLLKSFTIFTGVLYYGATITLFLNICMFLTSYFEVLRDCIVDIDKLFLKKMEDTIEEDNDSKTYHDKDEDSSQCYFSASFDTSRGKFIDTSGNKDNSNTIETNNEKQMKYLKEITKCHQKLFE